MPTAPQRRRSTLEQPGRLAAIGGAAVVCLLTVSGALGVSATGGGGNGRQTAALETTDRTSDVAASRPNPSRDAVNGARPPDGRRTADGAPATTDAGRTAAKAVADRAALPGGSGTGRRVVFDMSRQRVWLVAAGGTVARTYPVSGSRYDNLRPGSYSVFSRDARATAYNSNETMRYMVRFAYGRAAPIGFHSIPALPNGTFVETRAQLGTPQSDGCIRQWVTDARALWRFAPVGTKVVVRA